MPILPLFRSTQSPRLRSVTTVVPERSRRDNFLKIFLSLFLCFAFLLQTSCSNFSYGPPKTSAGFGMAPNHASGEFEANGLGEEKDKVGTAIFVGVAVVAGIAAGIILPLMIQNKI